MNSKKETYKQLVDNCDPFLNECPECNYKKICEQLVAKGIPRPYQYKGISEAAILSKNIETILLKKERKLANEQDN